MATHALYGSGFQTPSAFNFPLQADGAANFSAPCHYSYDNDNYKNESPLEEEESSRCHVVTTDGDNTGTHDSLAGVPSRWGMAQPEPVKIVGFHGTSHDDLQKNPAVMQYLREVLVNTSKATIVAS